MTVPSPLARESPAVRGDAAPTQALWDFVAATGLESLVVGTSKDPNAKITVLLVSPDTSAAVFAVKAPTTAIAERAVDVESAMLAELRSRGLGRLGETIPEVVSVVEFAGRRAAVVSALPGQPMSTLYARRRHTRDPARVERDFAAAAEWLARFQRATAGEPAPLEMTDDVGGRLRDRFDCEPALDDDLGRLEVIGSRLHRRLVPRTAVHGDFWAGNLLLTDGCVSGVVDWEAAIAWGEPVRDLVRFANVYALYLDLRTRPGRAVAGHPGLRADRWGAGIEYALNGSGWFPRLYRSFLEDGLARLGADPSAWRDAALAGVAEVAALTDHEDYARLHLELFRRLAAQEAA